MTPVSEGNSSTVGCILLAEDFVVLRVNEIVVRWLGFPAEQVTGHSLHSLLGGGGQFFLQSQILPMLRLKGNLEEVYLRMQQKAGGTVPVLGNFGYVSFEGKTCIEFSFLRISQRGQLEDELLRAKKLAEQASDAKTKFLGMMSHELRTPLQLISLNHQLLLENGLGPLTSDQAETLQSSEEATRSVVVLIDDILNFAQMEGAPVHVAMEKVPIDRALARAETSIRHRLVQSGLEFKSSCDPAGFTVLADPNRLQQILVNLLNNAIKFTPRGGTITLSARRSPEATVISIEDTGCGIPPDQFKRVFEPFVQLRSTIESTDKPGVGLGLAICRDLATAMGGRVEVQSTLGRGSVFSLLLPTP